MMVEPVEHAVSVRLLRNPVGNAGTRFGVPRLPCAAVHVWHTRKWSGLSGGKHGLPPYGPPGPCGHSLATPSCSVWNTMWEQASVGTGSFDGAGLYVILQFCTVGGIRHASGNEVEVEV